MKVIFLEKSSGTQHNVLDIMVNELNNEIERESEWKYFSKNISEISFISTAWSGTSDVEWQVRCVISYKAIITISLCSELNPTDDKILRALICFPF